MSQPVSFSASLDTRAWISTVLLPLFLIGSFVFMTNASEKNMEQIAWPLPLLVHGLLLLVYVFCWLYRVKSYDVLDRTLKINRTLQSVLISLDEIEKSEVIAKDDLQLVMRTFGNGGIFGYMGKYYHSNFGKMTWYATRMSNYALLTFKSGKKLILTPDDVSLVEVLNSKLT